MCICMCMFMFMSCACDSNNSGHVTVTTVGWPNGNYNNSMAADNMAAPLVPHRIHPHDWPNGNYIVTVGPVVRVDAVRYKWCCHIVCSHTVVIVTVGPAHCCYCYMPTVVAVTCT